MDARLGVATWTLCSLPAVSGDSELESDANDAVTQPSVARRFAAILLSAQRTCSSAAGTPDAAPQDIAGGRALRDIGRIVGALLLQLDVIQRRWRLRACSATQ